MSMAKCFPSACLVKPCLKINTSSQNGHFLVSLIQHISGTILGCMLHWQGDAFGSERVTKWQLRWWHSTCAVVPVDWVSIVEVLTVLALVALGREVTRPTQAAVGWAGGVAVTLAHCTDTH